MMGTWRKQWFFIIVGQIIYRFDSLS
jgi:hypothetical protein